MRAWAAAPSSGLGRSAVEATWPCAPRPLVARMAREPRAPGAAGGGFEARYADNAEDVARLCRRLLADPALAEDAAQETYLRARRGQASYDPAQPFRSWVLAIARNHCIDLLRRRSREGRIFDASDLDPADLGAAWPSPLQHAVDTEQRVALLAAVEALPDRYRVPLVLRYFEDLDYAALAAALDLTRDNVGVLLFRARCRLRERLEEHGW